ncbi:hypothetical protein AWM75_05565 [Aerococcus urinaehominis]|uniref:Uncharacterized protein n=1 Tax=Aerococcus urinaehominis TaxID=128944 RepID=A0A0X8FLH6_9LACT|nr:DUF1846 domain-containing protein [Aerococcus urinaehominis]AMB99494.1 hypothetical protein AWM75_05565 [Aerococcus urinaehominis]SDM26484.1 Uncharacterized protein, UPF0371 family [Aerococcus urinaehominis]
MRKIGFDTDKYLQEQSEKILSRVAGKDKLYLEFGGKLIGDKHAKRVLPGFDEDAKMKLLQTIRDKTEIIICIYAGDIESNKIRGDYGIPYNEEVLRLIREYENYHIPVNSVLLTRYAGQPAAKGFIKNLENRGIKVYTHQAIAGYPTDIEAIFGPEGFAKNDYIETTKPVVVVSAPGAGSGKLATCLNQLYHEHKRGMNASYAKFETFPVWNLPLKHPVNIAYEAATVDLNDVNMIDNYHYEAYGEVAVNYNRDINMFPVIKRIIENITEAPSIYQSPTDMGVNYIASGIIDDEVVIKAANQEIIRRYFNIENDYFKGHADKQVRRRMQIIMEESDLQPTDRVVVQPARDYEASVQDRLGVDNIQGVMALQLADGQIVTGRNGDVMDASAAIIVNSLKTLAGINDNIDLVAPMILNTIQELKRDALSNRVQALNANEILIALAISAVTNPTAKIAYDQLDQLVNCQAHATFMPSLENEQVLKRLGIDITSDANYASKNLYNS